MSSPARRLARSRDIDLARRGRREARSRARDSSWAWKDRSHLVSRPDAPPGLERAVLNGIYSVQFFSSATGWGRVIHLMVRRHDGQPARSWRDLQRIKDELVGPDRTAVEVYPPAGEVVDAANIYHLWVLPEGMALPFGLGASPDA